MKTLILVRHAKSDWTNEDLNDHDRTLNPRGKRDAPVMAEKLKSKITTPDLFLSSTAVRAITTAKIFANAFGVNETEIRTDRKLYNCRAEHVLKYLQQVDDKYQKVILFNHNPTVSEMVAYLSGKPFIDLPTCSVVILDFKMDSWKNLGIEKAVKFELDYPKN